MIDLKALLGEALSVTPDRVPDDATMEDMQAWDSLAHMDLVALVEERFALELTTDEIVAMTSLAALRALAAQRGVKAQ